MGLKLRILSVEFSLSAGSPSRMPLLMPLIPRPSSRFLLELDCIPPGVDDNNTHENLIVDCAVGMGGEEIEKLKTRLSDLTVEVRNTGVGALNDGVGADFVQKEKIVPRGFGPADCGARCASLDGDADRLVYFYVLSNGDKINLVDGDKTRLGVIQTAYANAASTDYLRQLGLEVVLTPTGVKYLHERLLSMILTSILKQMGMGPFCFQKLSCPGWILETKNFC